MTDAVIIVFNTTQKINVLSLGNVGLLNYLTISIIWMKTPLKIAPKTLRYVVSRAIKAGVEFSFASP